MAMESASKKRIISYDEKNEEEKIEKFFALIKGIREARDRLMDGSDDALLQREILDIKNKKRKLDQEEKKQSSVWKPSFQREDFMEETDQKLRSAHIIAAAAVVTSLQDSSSRKEEIDLKESLDLNLSL